MPLQVFREQPHLQGFRRGDQRPRLEATILVGASRVLKGIAAEDIDSRKHSVLKTDVLRWLLMKRKLSAGWPLQRLRTYRCA